MRLLREMGYRNVRYYRGGLENWTQHGLAFESVESLASAAGNRAVAPTSAPRGGGDWSDRLNELSVRRVFEIWLGVIVGFGLVYWSQAALGIAALRAGEHVAGPGWNGLGEALYFSFVTALSIGYGDIVPVGVTRMLAIAEGTGGLVLFGVLITKLVSRRQETLTSDIHRIAFEDRLGRVRTNLHLVLTELQAIAAQARAEDEGPSRARFGTRLESVVVVFAGELSVVRDLLYRPERTPDEEVLAAILANLSGVLEELGDLLDRLPAASRPRGLRANLGAVGRLAEEICGECVPRAYAGDLKDWMDRIRTQARRFA